MKMIWKFTLDPSGVVAMPKGAKVISAHEQDGEICIWAKVDNRAEKVNRFFHIVATGEPFPIMDEVKFVGTVFINELKVNDNVLVESRVRAYHIYEVEEQK